jgi:hypothetical protein
MILREGILRDAPHISTWTGKRLPLMAPEAAQIDIEDIAHGLAYQGSYRGQTSHFYSLAQHSLLVASLVPAQYRLAALLHDAAAAYLGETGLPMRSLWPALPVIEQALVAAIHERFGLSGFDAPALGRAHLIVLATEQRDLLPHRPENRVTRGRSAPIPRRIEFLSPEEARFQFMEAYAEVAPKTTRPPSSTARSMVATAGNPPLEGTGPVAARSARSRQESGMSRARRPA